MMTKLNIQLYYHMILQKSFWYANLVLKKHFLLLISILKTFVLLFFLVFFISILCNIMNVLTFTFDQFDASLLNSTYWFLLENMTGPIYFTSSVYPVSINK